MSESQPPRRSLAPSPEEAEIGLEVKGLDVEALDVVRRDLEPVEGVEIEDKGRKFEEEAVAQANAFEAAISTFLAMGGVVPRDVAA